MLYCSITTVKGSWLIFIRYISIVKCYWIENYTERFFVQDDEMRMFLDLSEMQDKCAA